MERRWRIGKAIGIISIILCFSLIPHISGAQSNPIKYRLYDLLIDEAIESGEGLKIRATMDGSTTLVPVGEVYKALGYQAQWDAKNQVMNLSKGDRKIKLEVGKDHGFRNGERIDIVTPTRYIGGEVYTSLGFVSRSTGVVFSKEEGKIYGYDRTIPSFDGYSGHKGLIKIDTAGSIYQKRYKKAKEIVSQITDPDMSDLQKLYELIDYIYGNSQYGRLMSQDGVPTHELEDYDSGISVLTHGVGIQGGFEQSLRALMMAADIRHVVTAIPGQIGNTWNIVHVDGENYHVDLGTLVKYSYDNPSTLDRDCSYRGLFTTDAVMEKQRWMGNTKYKNYSGLEANSQRLKEISNANHAAREGEWIYYNKLDGTPGFYKIKIDGTGKTKIHNDTPFDLKIQGDWIYYRQYNYGIDPERFYKIRKDGKERKELPITPEANKYLVAEEGIYYSSDKIYRTDLEGKNKKVISPYPAYKMKLAGDWLYYINSKDGNKLYRVHRKKGTNEMVVDQKNIVNFLVKEDFITYKVDGDRSLLDSYYSLTVES